MIKKIAQVLYIIILVTLASATIVEHFLGTPATHDLIYGSWWFIALWTLLAVTGAIYFLSRWRKMPLTVSNVNMLVLHLSFLVILVGAFITHTTSLQGIVHLRGDQPSNLCEEMVAGDSPKSHRLPFSLRLDRFQVSCHSGTESPSDYATTFVIMDGPETIHASVSMNNIFSYRHYRIYQASYDTDNNGSYLSVNHDPWGIGVAYTGYALLFLSLILMLVLPGSTFRRLLRSPLLRQGLFSALLLLLPLQAKAASADVAAPTVDRQTAQNLCLLLINYNGRICPMQTFAMDFTQKIYGNHRYHGLTSEQVLASWIFYPSEWSNEPFIRIKSKKMRDQWQLPEYVSMKTFFSRDAYLLGPVLQEYRDGNHDAFHKACNDIDSKLQILMSLRDGSVLTVLPHTEKGQTIWYSPTDSLPSDISQTEVLFMRNVFPLLFQQIASGQTDQANTIIQKVQEYQRKNGGNSLPSATQLKAEGLYNAFPMTSVLFMVNLFLGLMCFAVIFHKLGMGKTSFHGLSYNVSKNVARVLLFASWCALTYTLVLRFLISGTVPLANGYDTMLFVAWAVLLLTFLLSVAVGGMGMVACAFGFLLSGFFLLVSHLNMMDPSIGHVMPVLRSPLLSIHVSIIMISYALLALTFICGLTGLLLRSHDRELQALSRLLLYPAITTLGLGIFIGAIWANVSWGNYWSWDPKETWALITFMVYAIALHMQSLPWMRRPRHYHWFMMLAFLTLVMTYFGVNYFLSGMHSYA